MAGGARDGSAISMIEREDVVERDRLPTRGGVASRAVCPIFAAMMIVLGVARIAIFRRSREDVVDMALGTCNAGVRARQWEGGKVMVKGRGFPRRSRVTSRAVCPVLAAVAVVLGVARIA